MSDGLGDFSNRVTQLLFPVINRFTSTVVAYGYGGFGAWEQENEIKFTWSHYFLNVSVLGLYLLEHSTAYAPRRCSEHLFIC